MPTMTLAEHEANLRRKKWNPRPAIFTAYAIAAIITFGHSAATPSNCSKHRTHLQCETGNAIAAAAGWPFYWSWELQK